jgi:hypothetical protein
MQPRSRFNPISRRSWLLAGLATPLFSVRAAESLEVKYDGDNLHVSAPSLHFLIGKPLERLKDGASVAYVAQLTLLSDDHVTVLRRRPGRFVVSLDLWEKTFSVSQLGSSPRSAEGLSAVAAEVWCLDSLVIDTGGLARDRPFWLRFELATADQRDLASMPEERGLSLSTLVEFLSRKPKEGEPHWPALERRLRLSDLPRMTGRGRNV